MEGSADELSGPVLGGPFLEIPFPGVPFTGQAVARASITLPAARFSRSATTP